MADNTKINGTGGELLAKADYTPDYAFSGSELTLEALAKGQFARTTNSINGEILLKTDIRPRSQKLQAEVMLGVKFVTFTTKKSSPGSITTSEPYLVTSEWAGTYSLDTTYDCDVILNGVLLDKTKATTFKVVDGDGLQFRTKASSELNGKKTCSISGDYLLLVTFPNKEGNYVDFLDFGYFPSLIPSNWYQSDTLIVAGLAVGSTTTMFVGNNRFQIVKNDDQPSSVVEVANGDTVYLLFKGPPPVNFPHPTTYEILFRDKDDEVYPVGSVQVGPIVVNLKDSFIRQEVTEDFYSTASNTVTEVVTHLTESYLPTRASQAVTITSNPKISIQAYRAILGAVDTYWGKVDAPVYSTNMYPLLLTMGSGASVDMTALKLGQPPSVFIDQHPLLLVAGSGVSVDMTPLRLESNVFTSFTITPVKAETTTNIYNMSYELSKKAGSYATSMTFEHHVTKFDLLNTTYALLDYGSSALMGTGARTTVVEQAMNLYMPIAVSYQLLGVPSSNFLDSTYEFYEALNARYEVAADYAYYDMTAAFRLNATYNAEDNKNYSIPVDATYSHPTLKGNYPVQADYNRLTTYDPLSLTATYARRTDKIVVNSKPEYKAIPNRKVGFAASTITGRGDTNNHLYWGTETVYYSSSIKREFEGYFAKLSVTQFGEITPEYTLSEHRHQYGKNSYGLHASKQTITQIITPKLKDNSNAIFGTPFEAKLQEPHTTVIIGLESVVVSQPTYSVDTQFILVDEPVSQVKLLDSKSGYNTPEEAIVYAASLGFVEEEISLFRHNAKYGFTTSPEAVAAVCKIEIPAPKVKKVIFWT